MTLQKLEPTRTDNHIADLNQYSLEIAVSMESICTRKTRTFHESSASINIKKITIWSMKSELNPPFKDCSPL